MAILDTKQFAYEILGFERFQNGSSLEDIFRLLIHGKAGSFHNAGSDANYTLRVLNMLEFEIIEVSLCFQLL